MTSLAQQHPVKPISQPLQDDLCLVQERKQRTKPNVGHTAQELDEGVDFFSAQGLKDRERLGD